MSSRKPRFQDDGYDDDRKNDPRPRHPPTPPSTDDRDSRSSDTKPKSILVDPNEDPKDRQRRRSNSRVRVRPPPSVLHDSDSEGTVKGSYVRHRNGQVEFVPDEGRGEREPKRRTHDLENKTGDGSRRFRERRDGYESDEGESLRKMKRRPPPDSRDGIGDIDDDDDDDRRRIEKPKGRSAWDSQHVRSRKGNKDDDAFVLPDRTRPRRDPRADDDDAVIGKRRDLARKRYDSDDDDEVDVVPRRRPQRQNPRHERGYESEGPSRRRAEYDEDDRSPRVDRRRPARYDDDYPPPRKSDSRYDRNKLAPPRSKSDRYNDYDEYDNRRRSGPPEIRRARSDAKPRRDRNDDPRDRRDPRDGGKGKKVWAEQAGTLFMTHAMPVIKREGGRWAKKELENFIAQRR